jgi:ferredoxin-NADP reductase
MKAIINEKKEIAKGTLMIEFELLGQKISFKPGQFFFVKLINPPYNDDKGEQRHFSFVNSPNEKGVITLATRLGESAFKKSLNELRVGTEVEIDNIMGEFILPEDKTNQLVFIAGGIGITPFMSMLRYVKEEKLDYKVTLLYSNRNKESTAFFDELKKMSREMKKSFKLVMSMTDDAEWDGEKRRIDAQFIKDHVLDYADGVFMTAGPPGMVQAITGVLEELKIKKENIITENFSGY